MRTAVNINVKNEKRIIEFIKYYIKIGIDFFLILDDDSTEDVNEVLIKNNIDKNIYEVIYTNGRKFLRGIYNSKELWDNELIPILNKNNIDYMLFVDADEFLYLGNFKNINELISYYNPFDSLKINMLIFGSNNLIENNSDSIISQFNKSSKTLFNYVKCLTKVSSICTDKNKGFIPTSHTMNVDNGITKNIYNEIVSSQVTLTEKLNQTNYTFAPIYLAHYMCQDITTYIERKICSNFFLVYSQNYALTQDVINLINENKMLIIEFFLKSENTEYDVNNIHLKTTLPKDIIVFVKKHFGMINKNEVINNDIINFLV
jgi:hypothetical protein